MRALPIVLLAFAPFAAAAPGQTTVAVLGAIHSGHLRSKQYSVATVVETVRRYRPTVVLVEIPPDLYDASVKRVDKTGYRTTKKHLADLVWIGAFPELYRGVLPLRKELGYKVVPVSGWKPEVSADRRAFWRGRGKTDAVMVDRKEIYDTVSVALKEIREREGGVENAKFYNSRHYADLRQLERTLWAKCFDEGLGRGGEVAINRAHFSRIAKALDQHRGERVLIVYGAGHRYWFLKELEKRDDVTLVDVARFLP